MNSEDIDKLRLFSRKLLRELGILQLGHRHSKKTPAHWHALIEISRRDNLTPSELAEYLILSPSTISRIVNVLVKDNLVMMKQGTDKREKHLSLTQAGIDEIKDIDEFSNIRIKGACEFLPETTQKQIIDAIQKYAAALEESRRMRKDVKILTLSTSRTIRKQIISMVEDIQQNELLSPITKEINSCILNLEETFYFNNAYTFWYAVNPDGKIIGSIGLKKIDEENAEIKKLFVISEYRSKGVAQKLLAVLLKNAIKHRFQYVYLGTIGTFLPAQKFYNKYGFSLIEQNKLPDNFEACHLDTTFFKGEVATIYDHVVRSINNML